MVYPISRYTLFPFIRFFVRKTVGMENLPARGPYIIACKHIGPLDGIFIAASIIPTINQKIYFLTNVAPWGWFWERIVSERWAGAIPFYRDNPRATLEMGLDCLRQGKVVGIFPEGIIQDYDQRGRAKTGVARMAAWARVPIVPVGLVHDISIHLTVPRMRHNLPRMHQRRQAIANILLNPHSLEIHIGQPFELAEYYGQEFSSGQLAEATGKVMERIDALTNVKIAPYSQGTGGTTSDQR